MKLRPLGILLLEIIVIVGVLDISSIRAFDELVVVGYLLTYFIAALALFALSVIGIKSDSGFVRGLDVIGITTSAGSVLLTASYLLYGIAW